MATGARHASASVAGSLLLLGVAPLLYRTIGSGYLACPLGCLLGAVLTPDLDVRGRIYAHRLLRGRAGCLPSLLWRLLWYPYARLIPHRHWLSHAPLIGSLGRVLYLGVPIVGVSFLIGAPVAVAEVLASAWFRWGLIGLIASDALHWFMDFVL